MTKIVVAGAGSIGCFVGGVLAHTDADVRFLARPRIAKAVAQNGLHLTDYEGLDARLTDIVMRDDPNVLADADVVLVCVKSAATADIAQLVAAHARPDALVISLQNGVRNASILAEALPTHDVRAAMVPFNVVPKGPASFHRGTSGDILVQEGPIPDLSNRYVSWQSVDNIEGIQWSKLLINLGNAINALSDLPLLQTLQDRQFRRLMADQMTEALTVLKAAGITPAKTTAAPPKAIPFILRLPNPIFRRVAAQMLTVDAEARSSMWDDLTQRRPTEIDALQGEVIRLGQAHACPTPLNTRLKALIQEAEAAAKGPPGLSVRDIRG